MIGAGYSQLVARERHSRHREFKFDVEKKKGNLANQFFFVLDLMN